jgi:hypothetical protein
MFDKRKKGQSTVEYIVLVTAVIGVAVAFLLSPAGPFKQNLNSTLSNASAQMGVMAGRMTGGQALTNEFSPAPTTTLPGPCPTGQIRKVGADGAVTCVNF